MRAIRYTVALVTAVAMGGLFLPACGTTAGKAGQDDQTVTIKHQQGSTEVPVNPGSVLTFDMAALDTMDALGVEAVTGVPKESIPDYLTKYKGKDYTDIGTLFEPDYEAIPKTDPDLIIVAGRSANSYDDLAKDFTVIDLSIDSTHYEQSLRKQTKTLAKIFGKQSKAKQKLDDLDDRISDVHQAADRQGTGLVLLTSGGKVTAFGKGSRYDWIHSAFGVQPAVAKIKHKGHHGEAISFEYIRKADPDWMFVIDRDAAIGETGKSARQVLDNKLVAKTKAWQNDQVVYLNPQAWYIVGGGLATTSKMVEQFEQAFEV